MITEWADSGYCQSPRRGQHTASKTIFLDATDLIFLRSIPSANVCVTTALKHSNGKNIKC